MSEDEHEVEVWTRATCSCGWETSSESEGDVWIDVIAHQLAKEQEEE